MQFSGTGKRLEEILQRHMATETYKWFQEKLHNIIETASAKELYLTYSLLSGKINTTSLNGSNGVSEVTAYLNSHGADLLQIARIYLLVKVLEENKQYFHPKVANLIQVADAGELETFLKFLILLPHAEEFKNVAVEALRTNIATVFDAISSNNPYPGEHFNNSQWNQMYLKAAFMQRNLGNIMAIDKRANKDLARIISDYAHERWAASRDVDPLFWRPVTNFLEGELLKDMERLLESENTRENAAAALCCYHSDRPEARAMLKNYPELREQVKNEAIGWKNLKD